MKERLRQASVLPKSSLSIREPVKLSPAMSVNFQELDFQETPLGALSLRRRRIISLGELDVFEVQLGDAFLMSSLFHEVEVALADLGLEVQHKPAGTAVVEDPKLIQSLARIEHGIWLRERLMSVLR